MGEAKRRGTFEERKAAAIARDKKVQEEAERLFKIWKQKQADKVKTDEREAEKA